MSDVVLRVEGLYKQYRLGVIGATTLKDDVSRAWARMRGKKDLTPGIGSQKLSKDNEFVWALQDINFEVKRGDVVGIIGKNGAGKSTLLKILSKVTAPTKGEVAIKGRIASLLEVGTGFHPELTGRENIYLNGAILGMTKREVREKLEEIIDFSGVEKYIDTPVKRYSSGMYVRLAFAVAAHLEPEILIVDEVLAVGDSEFQKKCLGKMGEVAKEGRTVLFVSHNIEATTRLCNNAILLKEGKLDMQDTAEKVANYYFRSDHTTSALQKWDDLKRTPGNDIVRLSEVKVIIEDGTVTDNIDIRKPVGISFTYHVIEDGYIFTHGINLHNDMGVHVLSAHDVQTAKNKRRVNKGTYTSIAWIPGNLLAEGNLFASIAIMRYDPFEIWVYESNAVMFNVIDTMEGDSARGNYGGSFPGAVRPLLQWDLNKCS